MGKGFFIGNDSGKATKVKKLFVGDESGKARKVKKIWVGDENGKARLCFSGEKAISYYGTITNEGNFRYMPKEGSVGNYALFAGGQGGHNIYSYSSSYTKSVTAFNDKLTRSFATDLPVASRVSASANVGGQNGNVLFAGGIKDSTLHDDVTAYNSSLTQTILTLMRYNMTNGAGASVGTSCAFFSGKRTSSALSEYITGYNEALTQTVSKATGIKKQSHGGASVGNYAIFAGGFDANDNVLRTVHSVNTSFTVSSMTDLTNYGYCKGFTVGNYAIFMSYFDAWDVYDSSLTKRTSVVAPFVIDTPAQYGAVSFGDKAIIAGGKTGKDASMIIDTALTLQLGEPLSKARAGHGAKAGNYAVYFAGGEIGVASGTRYVDAYVYA